jgi:ubiquinone/menaquinone biosynthesis C-methylase UbiE
MNGKYSAKVPEEITRYYDEAAEEERLRRGASQLECERTKEVVQRYLPNAPATVLDVGGAAGVYSLWLAGLGFEVHLVDASPRLVEVARRRSEAAAHPIASCRVGDARELPFEDDAVAAVLMLGPLYHLTEAEDRQRALKEARRVLRPGGVLFAAAISRYASALDGLSRDGFADPSFGEIVEQDLKDGQHRNATDRIDYFTTAYFHRPEELREEVSDAGFECEAVIGLEGPGWLYADFDERWADARRREDLMKVARAFETEVSVVGVSAHLLAVGRKG